MSNKQSSPQTQSYHYVITTGLAMFSMFFGAGNIVFPLIVGQTTGNMVFWAMLGLVVTAVGVPFMGLLSMILFEGNYKSFFDRIGVLPGYLITLFIMILIGPLNAIPRCIALSYGAIHLYVPSLTLFAFSVFASLLMFALTVKKSRIVDILGEFLSPLLVLSLTVIIVKGLWSHPASFVAPVTAGEALNFGAIKGYNTMDLLGTFFFSGIIIASLRAHFPSEKKGSVLARYALQASCIGAGLLAIDYVAFAYLASYYGDHLVGVAPEALLGTLANAILGSAGGIVVSSAVALACLTTAVTLVVVFAEYIQNELSGGKVDYTTALVVTLALSSFFSLYGLSHIIAMFEPILFVIYPALIMLVICNGLYKYNGMSYVKLPVFITGGLAWIFYLFG